MKNNETLIIIGLSLLTLIIMGAGFFLGYQAGNSHGYWQGHTDGYNKRDDLQKKYDCTDKYWNVKLIEVPTKCLNYLKK